MLDIDEDIFSAISVSQVSVSCIIIVVCVICVLCVGEECSRQNTVRGFSQ